jgi:uncharacterized protein (TIGR03790 family)
MSLLWKSLLLVLCCGPATALAGGGPEGVLLVVNPQSLSSLTIANHYAHLRAIPPDNLLYLPWPPNQPTTDIDTFRQRILYPVLLTLRNRNLVGQIDYVVYSSDFPYGVTLDNDVRKIMEKMRQSAPPSEDKSGKGNESGGIEWPKHLTPVGAINGLTYLWEAVAAGLPAYFNPDSNHYMRPSDGASCDVPSAGFRAARHYGAHGEAAADGRRYLLSTMLGVTTNNVNSVDQVLAYLNRSATADGTHPKGTIYFVKNGDVRSKVRDGLFPQAVEQLTKLGVDAEILEGTVPLNKADVQGVQMGTVAFDWKASGSTILPGALCDNFTSFGGSITARCGQTLLCEFLRFGAAGASGTVTEPYAIASKFPSPMVQVHYARGCTLAEAFYQSIHSPYQLLVVGDPLCRPWANVPQVSVAGVEPGTVVHGTLTLKPTASVDRGEPVARFELFVDAQRAAECKAGGSLTLDTTKLSDGHHELRVVAVGPAPIESQGRQIIPVKTDNHDRKIEVSVPLPGVVRRNMTLRITAQSPGSKSIVAAQGSRVVGQISGEKGQINIPIGNLGTGPVQLRVVGLGQGSPATNVIAQPIEFVVE